MAGTDEELSNFNIMLAFGLPVSSEVPESNNENTESSNQEGSNNSQAAKTEQATQWAVSVFTGWS